MSAASLQFRYERKFVPDDFNLAEIRACVQRHPAGFCEVFPPRVVNNLYLDTPGLRHYHEHVNGLTNRLKVRLRWYGSPREQNGPPVLEFKIRHGLLCRKETYSMPIQAVNEDRPWARLRTALDEASLPDTAQVQLIGLEPAVMNRYHRRYFHSADARVRLTLDSELEFHCPRQASGALRALPPKGDGVIVELKYLAAHAEDAARVANSLPFRLTRCSKYVLGVERVNHH